ncbi:MAG: orotidine 5'-phosphate decarboxylase / HUMPS family protein [Adlercreutzia equolifaciens]
MGGISTGEDAVSSVPAHRGGWHGELCQSHRHRRRHRRHHRLLQPQGVKDVNELIGACNANRLRFRSCSRPRHRGARLRRLGGHSPCQLRATRVAQDRHDAVLRRGPGHREDVQAPGFNVFLDLKFHIRTRCRAARSAAAAGPTCSPHTGGTACGGGPAAARGRDGVRRTCRRPRHHGAHLHSPEALAYRRRPTPPEQVAALAAQAKEAGISGVVASPQEAAALREILGPDAFIVTPGVRPAGAALGDQSRVATPAQAFANGASHIVVGRPITEADDPVAAFEAIAAELV